MGIAVAAYVPERLNMKSGKSVLWFLALLPALFVSAFVLFPFTDMLLRFLNPGSIGAIAGQSLIGTLTARAISNSLIQGTLSALVAYAAGVPMGFFLGRYDFRFARLLRSFTIVPFFLPSIVVVTSFVSGFGPLSPAHVPALSSGLSGIVAINAFFNAPLVAMMTMLSVETADITLDEAAMTLGASGARRFFTVTGRQGLVAGAGGALLAFLYSFAGFTAPLIVGGPGYFTVEAWIYYMVRTANNIGFAAVLSFVETAALLVPALAYFIFVARTRKVYGTGRSGGTRHSRDGFFLAGSVYAALWILFEGYVLASAFSSSLYSARGGPSLANYITLFGPLTYSALGVSAAAAVMNSLFYGFMTAVMVTGIGLFWIYGRRRVKSVILEASDTLQFLPLVVSAIILSFSLAVTIGFSGGFRYDWVLIVIAQSVIAIPVVLRVIESGFSSIPSSYSEAATTLSGNPFFEIELPLARTTLASALVFGFAMSLGEFTATNFLSTTAYTPLGVQIYSLQAVRLFGPADAATAILLLMSLASFYIIQRIGEAFVALR